MPAASMDVSIERQPFFDDSNAAASSRTRWFVVMVVVVVGTADICMLVIYAVILSPTSPLFDRSDVAITASPLANPTIITPFMWSYFILCTIATPLALYQWRMLLSSTSTPSERGKCCRKASLMKTLCWMQAILPLFTFIAFMLAPSGMCTKGSFWFAKGGYCICDVRPSREATGVPQYSSVPPNLKIAFVGDTDLHNVEKVYALIRSERADGVVLNGDMDYWGGAKKWDELYQKHLATVPFYVTVGNHETWAWRDYQDVTAKRRAEHGLTSCRGSIGVRSVCTHKGVGLLLSGAGSGCGGLHSEHTAFFNETLHEFEKNNVTWRMCLIHKPEQGMTPGSTTARVGFDKYELCRQHGAIIINSHTHLYGRTHELAGISATERRVSRQVSPGSGVDAALIVGNGTSFAVVTGLGGGEMSVGERRFLQDPIWAATWDASKHLSLGQKVTGFGPNDETDFGAFFCSFNVEGDAQLARCYFKDVRGRVVDDFYVRRPAST